MSNRKLIERLKLEAEFLKIGDYDCPLAQLMEQAARTLEAIEHEALIDEALAARVKKGVEK